MNPFLNNLKTQAEQNPVVALAAGAALLSAASKFLGATTSRVNAKTWAKEVERRTMNTMKK